MRPCSGFDGSDGARRPAPFGFPCSRAEATGPDRFALDQAGGRVWLGYDAPGADVRPHLSTGHATLVHAPAEVKARIPVFQPRAHALAALERRVELGPEQIPDHLKLAIVAIEDAPLRERLRGFLEVQLKDKRNVWEMSSDGSFTQRRPKQVSAPGCQQAMIEAAEARQQEARQKQLLRPRAIARRTTR